MKLRNLFFGAAPKQRDLTLEAKKSEVKRSLMDLMAVASTIDAHLTIYASEGRLWVIGAGLEDDFEGLTFLNRAQYLINRDGIPIP